MNTVCTNMIRIEGKPRIAITMGDPSGIGPEVIIKGLTSFEWEELCQPIIIGSVAALEREMKNLNVGLDITRASSIDEIGCLSGVVLFEGGYSLSVDDICYGNLSVYGAKAVIDWIKTAVYLTLEGTTSAICTAPLNKAVLKEKARFKYPGHTEFLAHLTNTRQFVMMLAGKKLRVSLVTIHCPLSEVPKLLTVENILNTIVITAKALEEDFGIQEPLLAVAGLNPHAGEAGKFGREEIEIIGPAIKSARRSGINVSGPYPPDTVFYQAYKGKHHGVISMYHDQGLIPLKLVHFSDAVNVTLGLPIIRTSVDHGTAYDIAGRGMADPSSFVEALHLASTMAINRFKRGVSG